MSAFETDIILTGFSDEGSTDKTVDQQFSTMAALGLNHLSLRFIDIGNGVKNVMDLSEDEIDSVKSRLEDYDLRVSSIGSPIGKVKIADVDDESSNRYVPFDEYLENDVRIAIARAEAFDCKLLRGFSFYHPQHQDSSNYLNQAVDQLGAIAERCDEHGLSFGLEVETNLIGNTGQRLAEIHTAVGSHALMLVFDGGNLVTQGFDTSQIMDQFRAMLPGLGWIHIKDYARERDQPTEVGESIDEEALSQYVPADVGDSGHLQIMRELKSHLGSIHTRLQSRNVPGLFVDLEPHLRGGGQFGGFSGPDGMGVALRALCCLLDQANLTYRLRDFESMRR